MQRSKTSGSTGRDRSSRLRTTRVVVSRWSTVARSIGHDYHPTFMIGNEGGEGRGAHHLAATANGQSRSREARAPETSGSDRAGSAGQAGAKVLDLPCLTDGDSGRDFGSPHFLRKG